MALTFIGGGKRAGVVARGGRLAVLLALPLLAAFLAAPALASEYVASVNGALDPLIGYDHDAGGGSVNQTDRNQSVTIKITADQTFNSTMNANQPAWILFGGDDKSNPTATAAGFANVSINGLKSNGEYSTLTVTSTNPSLQRSIMKILNVSGTIDLANLRVAGGKLSGDQSVGGGAGLHLGAAPGSTTNGVPANAVKLTNVAVEDNHFTLTPSGGSDFGGGGGLYVDGWNYGSDTWHSAVGLTGVDLRNNRVSYTGYVDGNTAVYGGGGLIIGAKSVAIAGGVVENNSINADNVSHVLGGGLALDEIQNGGSINGTVFRDNTIVVNHTNTAVAPTVVAGGGALGIANYLDSHSAFTIGGGALFENNLVQVDSGVFVASPNYFAIGGAVYIESEATGLSTVDAAFEGVQGENMFSGNRTVSAYGTAYGGALGYMSDGNLTLSKVGFSNNSASGRNTAGGGALYVGDGANTRITDGVFNNNLATASYGDAVGGAVLVNSTGTTTLSANGTVFSGNKAVSAAGGAYGGAIFFDGDTLNLTDVAMTGNQAVGENAKGGAIFVETANAETTVNLFATAGKELLISGNRAGAASGIHFGTLGASSREATLNVNAAGGGKVSLLDPVSVDMRNVDFTFNKDGAGELVWDGRNTFTAQGATSHINLNTGTVTLGDSFTVKTVGQSSLDVTIGGGVEMRFNLSRNAGLAMFDFTDAQTVNKNFAVGAGATIGTTLGREILTFQRDYVVAAGLSLEQLNSALNNFVAAGAVTGLKTGSGGTLIASVDHISPYDKAMNPRSARQAVYDLVNEAGDNDGYLLTESEFNALYNHARAATPELYMDQGFIMLHGVDAVSASGVAMAVTQPHRARANAQSYFSIPSDAPCTIDGVYPPGGVRVWASYVGDFARRERDNDYNGYTADRHGVLAGVSYDANPSASIGLYGGYSHVVAKAKGIRSNDESDNYHVGLAGRVSPILSDPGLSITADVGYHHASNTIYRSLGSYRADGAFDQEVMSAGFGAEYDFCYNSYNFIPFLRARYMHLEQDVLKEHGFSATRVDGFKEDAFNTRLGLEASRDYIVGEDGIVSPSLSVAWRREWGGRRLGSTARYIQDPTPTDFAVTSAPVSTDSVDIGLAINALLRLGETPTLGLNLGYNFNISQQSYTHTLFAGFELGF